MARPKRWPKPEGQISYDLCGFGVVEVMSSLTPSDCAMTQDATDFDAARQSLLAHGECECEGAIRHPDLTHIYTQAPRPDSHIHRHPDLTHISTGTQT